MVESFNEYEGRILIVDDDRDFSDGLVEIIKSENRQVEQAFNKTQAIYKLDEFDPDIVLLDVRLGRSNGITVLNEIKERNHRALCIIITAYSSVESAIDALRQGAYDYLQKPIPPEKLINIIDNCFDRISMEREIQNHQIKLEELVDLKTAALKENKEMYKTLASVSPVGIMRIDKENNCVYTNDRWRYLSGTNDKEATLDTGWQDFLVPECRESFLKDWNLFVKTGMEHFRKECQFYREGTSHKWVIFQANKVENGGYVVTVVDITPQKSILPELMQFRQSLGGSL